MSETNLAEFAEATIAEMLDPALTLQGRAAAAVHAFVENVHLTKEGLAVNALQVFKPAALECIKSGDDIELARQIRVLHGHVPDLRQAVPTATQRDR